MAVDSAVADARSVASAAAAVTRSVQAGSRVERAAEHLEVQAARVVGSTRQGFDSGDEPPDDDTHAVGEALVQLDIGLTLISAEAALGSAQEARALSTAVAALERDADELERAEAPTGLVHGFETTRDGVLVDVATAAGLALDDMGAAATEAASAVLDRALRPVLARVPDDLQAAVAEWSQAGSGRLLRWGLKAVRKGLDLLLSVVSITRVEQARDRIDRLLAGLGQGRDARLVVDAAIGADVVRQELASAPLGDDPSTVVPDLARLSERFARLCTTLRRIALAVTSIAAALVVFQVGVPHGATLTVVALSVVLGAVVVLGRDYTGATDLPGRVVGVRRLVTAAP